MWSPRRGRKPDERSRETPHLPPKHRAYGVRERRSFWVLRLESIGLYVNYYAGLASAVIALVFLYYGAWIFVYGIELNAAIARLREAKA